MHALLACITNSARLMQQRCQQFLCLRVFGSCTYTQLDTIAAYSSAHSLLCGRPSVLSFVVCHSPHSAVYNAEYVGSDSRHALHRTAFKGG